MAIRIGGSVFINKDAQMNNSLPSHLVYMRHELVEREECERLIYRFFKSRKFGKGYKSLDKEYLLEHSYSSTVLIFANPLPNCSIFDL